MIFSQNFSHFTINLRFFYGILIDVYFFDDLLITSNINSMKILDLPKLVDNRMLHYAI